MGQWRAGSCPCRRHLFARLWSLCPLELISEQVSPLSSLRRIDEVAKKRFNVSRRLKGRPLIDYEWTKLRKGEQRLVREATGWKREWSSPWQMEFVKVGQYRAWRANRKYHINICTGCLGKRLLPREMMSNFLPRYENLISDVLVPRRAEPTTFCRGLFSHMHKISLYQRAAGDNLTRD